MFADQPASGSGAKAANRDAGTNTMPVKGIATRFAIGEMGAKS
jgi:hypothetical protein